MCVGTGLTPHTFLLVMCPGSCSSLSPVPPALSCYSNVSFKVAVAGIRIDAPGTPDTPIEHQVMHGFTISAVIFTRFTGYCRLFCFLRCGRFSICPSIRSLDQCSQGLLTVSRDSLLCQFAKATAALFRSSPVDTGSQASMINIHEYEHL